MINRLTNWLLIMLLLVIGGYLTTFFLSGPLVNVSAAFLFSKQDEYGLLASNMDRKLTEMPTLSESAITTSSGLQYEDVLVGEGKEAKRGDLLQRQQ